MAPGSLTLAGAVSMGTGVMIGAGIFALTGQIAELAGEWFPWAFLAAAGVAGFGSYSYVKLSNAYPSAGGIAMFLEKAYGKSVMTGACALLMYFSMVINESLVARTFGTYVLQPFDGSQEAWLVPFLGVGLLAFAFAVNPLGNRVVQTVSFFVALIKVFGVAAMGIAGLWVSGFSFRSVSVDPTDTSAGGFLGICLVLYLLVTVAVGGSLTLDEIVTARDYALAEAARPAFGDLGVWVTVGFAIAATVSGVIASVFAVSRMLAMLTEMKLVPHRHFRMPGDIQKHTLVYTIVFATVLTVLFDLSRIASLGAVFYIVMDIAVHWGVARTLRQELEAKLLDPLLSDRA